MAQRTTQPGNYVREQLGYPSVIAWKIKGHDPSAHQKYEFTWPS